MFNFMDLLSNLSSLGDFDFSDSSTRITRSLTQVFEVLENSSKTQEGKPPLILQTIANQLEENLTETNTKKGITTDLSKLFFLNLFLIMGLILQSNNNLMRICQKKWLQRLTRLIQS
jgi:hypothetical protein